MPTDANTDRSTRYEVERDRHGIMYSGPLDVGECVQVVPVKWCEETHARDLEWVKRTQAENDRLRAENERLRAAVRAHRDELDRAALNGPKRDRDMVDNDLYNATVELSAESDEGCE